MMQNDGALTVTHAHPMALKQPNGLRGAKAPAPIQMAKQALDMHLKHSLRLPIKIYLTITSIFSALTD
jgi:hypothetical protein